jgi:hypothetical protein
MIESLFLEVAVIDYKIENSFETFSKNKKISLFLKNTYLFPFLGIKKEPS